MKNFQLILLVVFIAFAVFGILVFSGFIPIGGDEAETGAQGEVILWGTTNVGVVQPVLEKFNYENKGLYVRYVQKNPDTFDRELLEALASGTGPDMFFLSNDLALSYSDKIFVIPYESYPLVSYKNNFAGVADVFLTSKGILAFPITVDPLVMYYNRSHLDTNGIVFPPQYWDELVALVPVLTKKDETKQISKSAVALGQFSNVLHAKEIISTIFMQAGSSIILEQDGSFVSSLNRVANNNPSNFGPILSFFTDFSDPLKPVYSWNRSLPNSGNFFSADNLTFYFGYASELPSIINRNPNQNFLVAPVPQIRNASYKTTYGKVEGIAVSPASKNFNTAYIVASMLSSGEFASNYAAARSVVPVRRDLLAARQTTDPFTPTFYSSALFAKSWLDPSPSDTDDVFRFMVDQVLSGSLSPSAAVSDASSKIEILLNK